MGTFHLELFSELQFLVFVALPYIILAVNGDEKFSATTGNLEPLLERKIFLSIIAIHTAIFRVADEISFEESDRDKFDERMSINRLIVTFPIL